MQRKDRIPAPYFIVGVLARMLVVAMVDTAVVFMLSAYLPLAVVAIVGQVIAGALIFRERRTSSAEALAWGWALVATPVVEAALIIWGIYLCAKAWHG